MYYSLKVIFLKTVSGIIGYFKIEDLPMNASEYLYFDYQATTPVSDRVLREMRPYFSESYASPHSADHAPGWESFRAVEKAAQQVARLIAADADEIVFTSGATESNNLALLGLAKHAAAEGAARKKILLSAIEHKSVLAVGRVLNEQLGFQVELLPVDESGHILLPDLERSLTDDVLIVSIMAVNNEIGTIQDIANLSGLIRQSGAIFHCDAAQAPIAIDMQNFANDTDLLSLSGHKIYGPKGIGALYIRRDLQESIEPLIYGGGQQNGLRSGTLPTPLCVGMGAAAEYLCSDQARNKREQLCRHRDRFVDKLLALSWPMTLCGPPVEYRHPGNANIGFKGFTAHDILNVLQPRLAASIGSACASGTQEPSHVLKAIGLTSDEAESSIRFSLGFNTSDQNIDEAIALIDKALNKLSGTSSSKK